MQLLRKGLSINEIIHWCIENKNATNTMILRCWKLVLSLYSVCPKLQHFDAYNYSNSTPEEKEIAKEAYLREMEQNLEKEKQREVAQSLSAAQNLEGEDDLSLLEESEDEDKNQNESEKLLCKKAKNATYKHSDIVTKVIQYSNRKFKNTRVAKR